jgi:hypothetical protein
VVTGGQTGVDRAAVDVGIELGLPYGGWVPRDGWAEDFERPPGLLTRYPGFWESDSDDPDVRTARNVYEADATLVLTVTDAPSPGTERTCRCAAAAPRPLGVVDLGAASRATSLAALVTSLTWPSTLNIAGPRSSEVPGIYAEARSFLLEHRTLLFGT